jgi:hypothetical protein
MLFDVPYAAWSKTSWLFLNERLSPQMETALGCTAADGRHCYIYISDSPYPSGSGNQTVVTGQMKLYQIPAGASYAYDIHDVRACLLVRSKQASFFLSQGQSGSNSNIVLPYVVVGSVQIADVVESKNSSESSGVALYVLILIVVGGVLLSITFGVLVWFCCRRRRALEASRVSNVSQQSGIGIAQVQLQGVPMQTYGQMPVGYMQHV